MLVGADLPAMPMQTIAGGSEDGGGAASSFESDAILNRFPGRLFSVRGVQSREVGAVFAKPVRNVEASRILSPATTNPDKVPRAGPLNNAH